MYRNIFIHPSVDGLVGRFHFVVPVNHAAVNSAVHVSFLIMVFSGYMPSSGIAKRNKFESVLLRWMNLEPVTQSEVSQKEKKVLYINAYMESRKMVLINPFAGRD